MSSRYITDVKKLFEYWCEVKYVPRKNDGNGGHTYNSISPGIIVESFPESFRDKKTISEIPAFAFPCKFESNYVQTFSFVFTTDDSKWRFGFCRQDPETESAMVMITHLPWHDMFWKFMAFLAEFRRTNPSDFQTYLAETYNNGVPDPSGDIKITFDNFKNFEFKGPLQFQLPSIPENHNLSLYYSFAHADTMIAVFAAMLAERRIIFTSQNLDYISSCVQAANAFLYPMVWQHIFTPVLPMKLKEFLGAPMPYLIGVPESVLKTMMPEELGDVVIFNCDTKELKSPFKDVNAMPSEIVSNLKKQLNNTHDHKGERISKIFLSVLIQLIGGYNDGVEYHDTGRTFNEEQFIESRPPHLRSFLKKLMESQIFQQFIDERLQMQNTGKEFSDPFVFGYAGDREEHERGNILKTVKQKTNPVVKSAVKSIKESSRGFKTYYKDMKTKLRYATPSTHGIGSHKPSPLSSSSQHDSIDSSKFNRGKMSGAHRSAPTSPIFSRRTTSTTNPHGVHVLNGTSQHLRLSPIQLATSSSSAIVHTNLNGGSTASPSVSPASSLASSEMNLSQELQNHPLFKTPIVDRTLKPSFSLEPNHIIYGASTLNRKVSLSRQKPIIMSDVGRYRKTATPITYYNHPYNAQQPQQQQQQLLRPIDNHNHNELQQQMSIHPSQQTKIPIAHKIVTTASPYDNPPDMLSPPVPPRRQNSNNSMASVQSYRTAVVALHAERSNNDWQKYTNGDEQLLRNYSSSSTTSSASPATASILSSSSITSDSSVSFISAASTLSQISPKLQHHHQQQQQHQHLQPPVPAPRLRKEVDYAHMPMS